MIGRQAAGQYRNPEKNKRRMPPPVKGVPNIELPPPIDFLEVEGEIVATAPCDRERLLVFILATNGLIYACPYDRVVVQTKGQ